MSDLEIDSNAQRLDLDMIQAFISTAYWAKGRTPETMKTCIDHSLNYGLYLHNRQIGYARVVTDYGQFAYLMDVFILEDFRGRGYSKKLMSHIMNDEKLAEFKVWRLATNDAHELYKHFGFAALAHPENLMELVKTVD